MKQPSFMDSHNIQRQARFSPTLIGWLLFLALITMLGCAPTTSDNLPTQTPEPPVQPEPSQPETPAAETAELTYSSDSFSLAYPDNLTFYEGERPSVEGALTPLPDGIALQGERFLLTLTAYPIQPGTALSEFIAMEVACPSLGAGLPTSLGNLPALRHSDTGCGLNSTTFLFAVSQDHGYQLTIETADSFAAIETAVQPILDSFEDKTGAQSRVQIEQDGIFLTYDPAWLGEAQIQQIAATANQGLFEQPSPAHTWIGFAPAGIVRDVTNHWSILREPAFYIYRLQDFGSLATMDVVARERVAQLEQVLAKRPSSFSEEVPIIVPLNAGQAFWAQVDYLDFGNGSGVRFVTQFMQDYQPVNNSELYYIFQGRTADGLHGVTAVFPLTASGLPADGTQSEAEYVALRDNFSAEMTAVTEQLNALSDADFGPTLTQLDGLVQSLTVAATEDDFVVLVSEPTSAQMVEDANILSNPTIVGEVIGRLEAGDPIISNGVSETGEFTRILCSDGATGDCWVYSSLVAPRSEPLGLGGQPNFPWLVEGEQVASLTAVSNNIIYDQPGDGQQMVGELLAGEGVEVFGVDESGAWVEVVCPRNIGQTCWVTSDTAVNEPSGFYVGDGWKDVNGEHVFFRVPEEWAMTAVVPGMGSVLEEWFLGIPGVESDQTIGFFAPPFDQLQPSDVISEDEIFFGGEQSGLKWVRGDDSYRSYDYYTAGTAVTQAAGAGSFGLHVTVAEADPELESILDMVMASVVFK